MGNLKATSITTTGMNSVDFDDTYSGINSSAKDLYQIESKETDGATGLNETSYQANWTKWHGYYRTIPEFQAIIDKLASWTLGKGFEADEKNKEKVEKIKGFGKDNFNSILRNMIRTMLICGDSFAEIIKDKNGRITNIKPLNSGSIKIIVDEYGIIKRYEQVAQNKKVVQVFDVENIFHLCNNRIGDEIHGIPFGEKLETLILMRNECMNDYRILVHRNIKPIQWIEADTDDSTSLSTIQNKIDEAYKKTENIIVPKGVIGEIKNMNQGLMDVLDPINWLKFLVRQFVTSCGVPEIIMGWGEGVTEASAKIIYLAFQQTIEEMQLYIEINVKDQLNIEIKLNFPADLMEATGEGKVTNPNSFKKDGNKGFQNNDVKEKKPVQKEQMGNNL